LKKEKPGLLRALLLPTVVVAIVATSIVSRAIVVIGIRSTAVIAVSRAIIVAVIGGIGCGCGA
jgi:uncharacterized membrane protein YqjE